MCCLRVYLNQFLFVKKPCYLFLILGLVSFSYQEAYAENIKKMPKNIIFMIGDGMGFSYLSAYRYYRHASQKNIFIHTEKTLFDKILVGSSGTHPHDETLVTDSAASATALSTGTKTYNGAIGVNIDRQVLPVFFEKAKEKNLLTGLVVTSPITHATPASFYAHHVSRKDQSHIANEFYKSSNQKVPLVDLAFGGGLSFFKREDRDLTKELESLGYGFVSDMSKLNSLKKIPALGIFGDYGLPSALDNNVYALADMTDHALNLLDKEDRGFVLLVEGSQIDWCGHANDIACAMSEMHAFELALSKALNFAKKDRETLVIVTADHETGGLSLGATGEYQWLAKDVLKIQAGSISIAAEILKTDLSHTAIYDVWERYTGLSLSSSDVSRLKQAAVDFRKSKADWDIGTGPLIVAINELINSKTYTAWGTSGHTAADVPVMAYGVGARHFVGFNDNTEIARILHRLVDKIQR